MYRSESLETALGNLIYTRDTSVKARFDVSRRVVDVIFKLPSGEYFGYEVHPDADQIEEAKYALNNILVALTDPTEGEVSDQERLDKMDTMLNLMKELMEEE